MISNKGVHNDDPEYLSDLMRSYKSTRTLRSAVWTHVKAGYNLFAVCVCVSVRARACVHVCVHYTRSHLYLKVILIGCSAKQ